jgi:hypothetical protein
MTFSKSLVDRANSVRNINCDSGHKDDEELEGQGVAAIWFNLVNRVAARLRP